MSSRVKKMRAIPSMGALQHEIQSLREDNAVLERRVEALKRSLDHANNQIRLHEQLRAPNGLPRAFATADPTAEYSVVATVSLQGANAVAAKGAHVIIRETIQRNIDQVGILLANTTPEHVYSYVSGVSVELKGPDSHQ